MARGERTARWRWWILSGVLALVYLRSSGRMVARVQQRLARGLLRRVCASRRHPSAIDARTFRMMEESEIAVAPLILFALLWLVADIPKPTNAQGRSR